MSEGPGENGAKRWVPHPYTQCDEHGAGVEIFTEADQTDGVSAFDGDECRCDEGCKGWMTADEDLFHCNWHEQEDG